MHVVVRIRRWSSVGGGYYNSNYAFAGVVGGGYTNRNYGYASVVSGGYSNWAYGSYTTVAGGGYSYTYRAFGTVSGGGYHYSYGYGSTISGGMYHRTYGSWSTVGGGMYNTVYNSWSTVGGGWYNLASTQGTVGGGYKNLNYGNAGVIGGGYNNYLYSTYGAVSGGAYNYVYTYGATVSGGTNNSNYGFVATVGGGYANKNYGYAGAIGGGYTNFNSGHSGVISGGYGNSVYSKFATISGGAYNYGYAYGATVGGGTNNSNYGYGGTVGGGYANKNYGYAGVVAGGYTNGNYGYAGVVGGGYSNWVYEGYATIVGGGYNSVYGAGSTISGGQYNYASGQWSVVSGGYYNSVLADFAIVGGGGYNYADGEASTVGGGVKNFALADHATIAGGTDNEARGIAAFVGGGGIANGGNNASGFASVVSGGFRNKASGNRAMVGGGRDNLASGSEATVGGGDNNEATGVRAVVGGGGSNFASGNAAAAVSGFRNTATAPFAAIVGGFWNSASGDGSVICGGGLNAGTDDYVAVGGGWQNTATAASATIGGGTNNAVLASRGTIGGGGNNVAIGYAATVSGGERHNASGNSSFIGGGNSNVVPSSGALASIAGGHRNTAVGFASFVGGGGADVGGSGGNVASGDWSLVSAGHRNSAQGAYAAVTGGRKNTAAAEVTTIGGGWSNVAASVGATVAGGANNAALGNYSSASGGYGNTAGFAAYASVAGGFQNAASGRGSAVSGGTWNSASTEASSIGGGRGNRASAFGASVGGGIYNTASAGRATVGGGSTNAASAASATVSGGYHVTASGSYATIGGGAWIVAAGAFSVVAGGQYNTASGPYATISGGQFNLASGVHAAIAGGGGFYDSQVGKWVGFNVASGPWSFVGGGRYNTAAGQDSIVLGSRAHAVHANSAVISVVESTGYACNSTGVGTVNVCTDGGFFINGALLNASNFQERLNAAASDIVANRANNTVLQQQLDLLLTDMDGSAATLGNITTTVNSHDQTILLLQETSTALLANLAVQQRHFDALSAGFRNHSSSIDSTAESVVNLQADAIRLAGNDTAQQVQLDKLAAEFNLVHAVAAENLDSVNAFGIALADLRDNITDHQDLFKLVTSTTNDLRFNQSDMHTQLTELKSNVQGTTRTSNANGIAIARLNVSSVAIGHNVTSHRARLAALSMHLENHTLSLGGLDKSVASLQADAGRLEGNNTAQQVQIDKLRADFELVHAAVDGHTFVLQNNSVAIGDVANEIELLRTDFVSNASSVHLQLDFLTTLSINHSLANEVNSASIADLSMSLWANVTTHQQQLRSMSTTTTELVARIDNNTDDVAVCRKDIETLTAASTDLAEADTTFRSALNRLNATTASHTSILLRHGEQLAIVEVTATAVSDNVSFVQGHLANVESTVSAHASTLSGLDIKFATLVDNGSVLEQQLVYCRNNNTAQDRRIAALESAATSQHLALDMLNATVKEQRHSLAQQQALITSLSADATALTQTVEQLLQATSFAAVQEDTTDTTDTASTTAMPTHLDTTVFATLNCGNDADEPCGIGMLSTTVAATQTGTDSEPAPLAPIPVRMELCYTYPCDSAAPLAWPLAWNQPLVVAGVILDERAHVAAAAFHFELVSSLTGARMWSTASPSRFATLTAADVPLEAGEAYDLVLTIKFAGAYAQQTADAVVPNVSFAAPPVVLSVNVELVRSLPAVNHFAVSVEATGSGGDADLLTYGYRLVEFPLAGKVFDIDTASTPQITVVVPSTRSYFVQVTVTNEYGSSTTCTLFNRTDTSTRSEACPLALTSVTNVPAAEVVHSAVKLLTAGNATASVLLAGLDALRSAVLSTGANATLQRLLLDAFFDHVARANATTVSEDVIVLAELVSLATQRTGAAFVSAVDAMGNRLATSGVEASTLEVYLGAVDELRLATTTDNTHGNEIAVLDEGLNDVCTASLAGRAPDGQVSSYELYSFSLNCALAETGAASVHAESATLLLTASDVTTITITSWSNGSSIPINANAAALMSDVHGVFATTIAGGTPPEASNLADDVFDLAIRLDSSSTAASASNSVALRQKVSCRYFDVQRGVWSERGVILRGLGMMEHSNVSKASLSVSAMCVSTHLTLFSVEDGSEAARVVEAKITAFGDRVAAMNNVDLVDSTSNINWVVPVVFCCVTALFMLAVSIAKVMVRKNAVHAARFVFRREGCLAPPRVVGSTEYEAILRGWLSRKEAAQLLFLDIATTNAFWGLFFRWGHGGIVYSQADKATSLYAALLVTFVSSAFFFETTDQGATHTDWAVNLWSAVVSAVAANLLVLPVEYILPYMISNVNSFASSTRRPQSLIRRQLNWLKQRVFGRRKAKQLRAARDTQAAAVFAWTEWTAVRRLDREVTLQSTVGLTTDLSQNTFVDGTGRRASEAATSGHEQFGKQQHIVPDSNSRASTHRSLSPRSVSQIHRDMGLSFLCCRVHVPVSHAHALYRLDEKGRAALAKRHASVATTVPMTGSIMLFQHSARTALRRRETARELEFDSWYNGEKRRRHVLAGLSTAVLLVLVTFTLLVCLLLSAAFTVDECLLWALDVAQSAALQIFVTNPAISLLVLSTKLLVSWLLLRAGRRRQHDTRTADMRRKQRRWLQKQTRALSEAEIADARAAALKTLVTGDSAVVAAARKSQQTIKQQQTAMLATIVAAKAKYERQRRRATTSKIKSETASETTQQRRLIEQEKRTRQTLRAVKVGFASVVDSVVVVVVDVVRSDAAYWFHHVVTVG